MPGTSRWWCTVPAEDAQEGVGGMARRNSTLSFRHAPPPPPPPRKHHPRKGLHPPPCLGRRKECPLAAGCLATLTGHCAHTKPAEPGLCPRAQGQVCRDRRPCHRHGALQQQALGKVAAAGLLPPGWASWVAVGAGSQAGQLPYPVPCPWQRQLFQLGGKSMGSYFPAVCCVSLKHREVPSQGWPLKAFPG